MKAMILIVPLLVAPCGAASAQTNASFKLTEQAMNSGCHPAASASFRISQGAIGDAAVRSGLSSAGYREDGGFVVRYAPPGEVHDVRFADKINVTWSRDPSAGTYNLYRNTLASLPGNFGSCYQSSLVGSQFAETDAPAQGSGWHYLITAENRLREEGTKGTTSSGAVRSNQSACP